MLWPLVVPTSCNRTYPIHLSRSSFLQSLPLFSQTNVILFYLLLKFFSKCFLFSHGKKAFLSQDFKNTFLCFLGFDIFIYDAFQCYFFNYVINFKFLIRRPGLISLLLAQWRIIYVQKYTHLRIQIDWLSCWCIHYLQKEMEHFHYPKS
jgi:hypothetical protein